MSTSPPLGRSFVLHGRAELLFPSIHVHLGSLVPQFPHQQNKSSWALPSSYLGKWFQLVRHLRKINQGNTSSLIFVMQQFAPPAIGRKQNCIFKHS